VDADHAVIDLARIDQRVEIGLAERDVAMFSRMSTPKRSIFALSMRATGD
jgi:hypothetical protein